MKTKLKFKLNEKFLRGSNEKEELVQQQEPSIDYTPDEKKQFIQAVANFNEYSMKVYRDYDLKDITKSLETISEMGANMMKKSVEDDELWFDNITIGRHIKTLKENIKLFSRTAREITELQHRLENSYEELGQLLSKYYDIK